MSELSSKEQWKSYLEGVEGIDDVSILIDGLLVSGFWAKIIVTDHDLVQASVHGEEWLVQRLFETLKRLGGRF